MKPGRISGLGDQAAEPLSWNHTGFREWLSSHPLEYTVYGLAVYGSQSRFASHPRRQGGRCAVRNAQRRKTPPYGSPRTHSSLCARGRHLPRGALRQWPRAAGPTVA